MDKDTIQKEILQMIKNGSLKSAVSQINSMEWNLTGSWRTHRPFYEMKNAPCKLACPAMENIPVWVDLIKRGKIKDAWQVYISENPFPAICGRVCFKFCEAKCNRKEFDESIAINALERFLGDQALANNWRPLISTNKQIGRVAVVGAGPAGLSAVYFLRQKGFISTLYDAVPEPGGLLRIGIPDYRLPKSILWREIANNILSSGVGLWLGNKVDAITFAGLKRSYDHVIVATGAHVSKQLGIEGEDLPGVVGGLEFLKRIKTESVNSSRDVGPRVAVIGGGNTAIDAARSALRVKDVKQVMIIYRRSEVEMPAHADEVEEAKKEGIKFMFLAAPLKIKMGAVENILECQKMKLGEADITGRRKPIPVENSEFEITADLIIKAVGEESFIDFETGSNVLIIGDAFSGPASVAQAVASGKKAAQIISGETPDIQQAQQVKFPDLNCDYFEKIPKVLSKKQLPLERIKNFSEVNIGLDNAEVMKEAARCFNCGFCNNCDNCFNFCPDAAVIKTDDGLKIDYDYCKGCLICITECPRNFIGVLKEGENA